MKCYYYPGCDCAPSYQRGCVQPQPLHERPLHITPKPVPRHEPTMPAISYRDARWDWGTEKSKFLSTHMEPIENEE